MIVYIMDARDILVFNVDRLCQEKGWKHFRLASEMGVKPESQSRSLNGLPRIDTIEIMAKALDDSIKSLFDDTDAIEGFVSVRCKLHRFDIIPVSLGSGVKDKTNSLPTYKPQQKRQGRKW